jgi:MtN3 and saliva related transmembrane protein
VEPGLYSLTLHPPNAKNTNPAVHCSRGSGCVRIRLIFCLKSGGLALASVEYLGLIAGLLTTFALVPQIIRVYKLKSAREISLLYNSTMLAGVVIWLIYGIVQGLASLIIWNIIGIALNSWLLLAKIKYGRQKS